MTHDFFTGICPTCMIPIFARIIINFSRARGSGRNACYFTLEYLYHLHLHSSNLVKGVTTIHDQQLHRLVLTHVFHSCCSFKTLASAYGEYQQAQRQRNSEGSHTDSNTPSLFEKDLIQLEGTPALMPPDLAVDQEFHVPFV